MTETYNTQECHTAWTSGAKGKKLNTAGKHPAKAGAGQHARPICGKRQSPALPSAGRTEQQTTHPRRSGSQSAASKKEFPLLVGRCNDGRRECCGRALSKDTVIEDSNPQHPRAASFRPKKAKRAAAAKAAQRGSLSSSPPLYPECRDIVKSNKAPVGHYL